MIISLTPKKYEVVHLALDSLLYNLELIEDRKELTLEEAETLKIVRNIKKTI